MEEQNQDDKIHGDLLPIIEEEKSFISKFFSTLVMLAALGGLGVLGWFAYEEGKSPVGFEQLPLIKAETSPFKIKPEDPGGMEIPNKDKAIYDTITSAETDESKEGEREIKIVPPPEEPVDLEDLVKTQPELSSIADIDDEKEEDKSEEKMVKEEEIKMEEKAEEKVQIGKEKPALNVIRLSEVPIKPEKKNIKINKITTPDSSGPVEIVFKPRLVIEGTAKEKPGESVEKKEHRVQLSSYKTPETLQLGWITLQKKFPELLGDLRHSVEIVDLKEKGKYYRLQAGPFSDKDVADNLCKKLIEKNQSCLIAK